MGIITCNFKSLFYQKLCWQKVLESCCAQLSPTQRYLGHPDVLPRSHIWLCTMMPWCWGELGSSAEDVEP